MKSNSRKRLQRGAVIAVLLGIANMSLTLYCAKMLHDDMQATAYTHQVQTELATLLTLMVDSETGQRGYVITGEEVYLEPFEDAVMKITGQYAKLEELLENDPKQKARLATLKQISDERLVQLRGTIELRRLGGVTAVTDIVKTGAGKRVMDRFRASVAEMWNVERMTMRLQSQRSDLAYWISWVFGIGAGTATLTALGLFLGASLRFTNESEQSARELFRRHEMLRTTLASIGDAVITTDATGAVTNLNGIAETLTGWTTQEAEGRSLVEIFRIVNETTGEPVENPAFRALKEGVIVGLANHTILIAKDGARRPIDDSAAPIKSSDGTISGCVLVFRDVSDRRNYEDQLTESEQTFRAIFYQSPIGIAHFDLSGRFLRVNNQFCEILDCELEDIDQSDVLKVIYADDLRAFEDLRQRVLAGDTSSESRDIRFISRCGEIVWVSFSVTLVRDSEGRPVSYVATLKDIRESRVAEEARILLTSIISSSNDAIISKDCDGIVTTWNPAAQKLFGYSESEMVGQSIMKIVSEHKHQEELDLLDRLRRGDPISHYKTTRIHKNGTIIEVLLNISPIRNADNLIIGVSSIAKDITAELQAALDLQDSESRFRTLADNISLFAWMADAEGSTYWFNKRWYDYTGTELEEVAGWGWTNYIHPDHVERVVASIRQSWATGEQWEDTFPIRGSDGRFRWFLSRALPIRDDEGRIVNWFGSNTDISDLKDNEESLHVARQAAEAANNARGEFLANMSHEIRTPMTAILGHADILIEHIQNPDNLQAVETIRRNGKFLLQIINDILDVSKIDAGKFAVEREIVSPHAMLAEVESLMSVRAAEKRLRFQTIIIDPLPRLIRTDPVRLRQILLNLVGNAIKFTDQGHVSLTGKYLSASNQLQLEIEDSGIGISAADVERLFEPFMQADTSSTRAYEGTGLGLAISRRLARSLGGDITVESRLGEGSRFTVVIACGDVSDSELTSAIVVPHESIRGSDRFTRIEGVVMVVDDRRDIRFLAQNFVEKAGGRVIVATNGAEAIEILTTGGKSDHVDLVLMDMQMPIMDGYTAVAELRRLGFAKPIIALTANAMKDDREKCLVSGCNDYLTKPLDGPGLVHIVAKYIAESKCNQD